MASAADQQNMLGIERAFARHVHGQFFAIATFFGVHMGFHLKPCLLRGAQKLLPGFGVAFRKCGVNAGHESSK